MSAFRWTSGQPSRPAHTLQWAGLKGKKNGELLKAAVIAGYDVLLTVDQGISRQRPPVDPMLSIILLRSRTNQMEDLLPLAPAILRALDWIRPGQTPVVPLSGKPTTEPAADAS